MEKSVDFGQCEPSNTANKEPIIFKSPIHEMGAKLKIPDVSVTDFMFKSLEMNYEVLKDEDWVVDVIKGTSYKFRDIKPLTTKVASALTRKGFKKGDVLYFVTYDMALIYLIEIGVWRCGGAVRGYFQREAKEEFERQMRETSTRIVLCDSETAPSVKWAVNQLDWPVQLLSIGGDVEGATPIEEMIENDDCSAFPHDVKINPKEDVISIPNTSGSTGIPKGAMHTHYNLVSLGTSMGGPTKLGESRVMGKSCLSLSANFSAGTLATKCMSISFGFSYYGISKFDQKTFLKHVLKSKPETLFIYPYVATWLARAPELDMHDFSFIKNIACGGSVLDIVTSRLLSTRLPQIKLIQGYGMSEILAGTSSELSRLTTNKNNEDETIAGLKLKGLDEEVHVSSGVLLPLAEAKIMDPNLGHTVGPNIKGNLWLKVPYIMKGYVSSSSSKGYVSKIDEDGWFDTEDVGFFDEAGHLYVVERRKSIFKYRMHQVSPAEIEAVIGEHPAVLSVGVVGVPDPLTTSAAWAYVVLKPDSQVTEEEIKQYVAERKIFYKHLHGGVEFVDILPMNRGGKLDRTALLQMAMEKAKSKTENQLQQLSLNSIL